MWFHIKALEPGINKVITFWLGADSKEDLDKILKKKNIFLIFLIFYTMLIKVLPMFWVEKMKCWELTELKI